MFKRTIWFTIGTATGLGGSVYAQRRLRQKLAQYYPEQAARRVTASVKTLSADVVAAAKEGRTAMQQREAALRSNRQ